MFKTKRRVSIIMWEPSKKFCAASERIRLGILPVVGTDGSRRKKHLGRFRTHDSPEGDFYSSNVESESAEATGGARLGSPMHSRIFRVLIGG
jgi:hypothetical protein